MLFVSIHPQLTRYKFLLAVQERFIYYRLVNYKLQQKHPLCRLNLELIPLRCLQAIHQAEAPFAFCRRDRKGINSLEQRHHRLI